MKNAGALSWSEVDSGEAALVARCTPAMRWRARSWSPRTSEWSMLSRSTCSGIATRRSTSRRRSSCALPHALSLPRPVCVAHLDLPYSINQAKNRIRWWHRRRRGDQVSLDDHLGESGTSNRSRTSCRTGCLPARKRPRRSGRRWPLPFDQRTALILREIDGLRYEEIAFTLDVAVGTVKSRLTRARQALRADLLGIRP